ncbi:MAG: alpha/beta fold hydrolase [candidate division Zixibacteria bacterium]|nr:alpha/beta fold hydrolase [candidate division Zixibacteria bacterium]
MRNKTATGILLISVLFFVTLSLAYEDQVIKGVWMGTLKFTGTELRVLFKILKTPDGKLTATLDSPDQGAKDIPVEEVIFQNGHLRLDVKSINGIFEGDIKEDRTTIEGQWSQGGVSIPLVLKRSDKAPEVLRPQEPKPPYPYKEKEVLYENKTAGIKIAGTLTLPRSEGPFVAALLITGSGPQDRDEAVFGHRPFLVLADYLTRRGIAVLRVDDRGIGKSTGSFATATSEDFADDVLKGVEYLKSLKEVNPKQIGLIGHSEGGYLAPMAATQSPDISFIIMMAGTGLTGEEIIYLQSALILKANGISDDVINKDLQLKKQVFAVVKEEQDTVEVERKLRTMFNDALAQMSEEEKQTMGYSKETLDLSLKEMKSPWLRYFLTYDPKPTLMKVKCPVLAINGEKDLQVPPKENIKAIEEALKAGGNKDYTVKEMPGLNHLFQTAQTGSPTEYSRIEETISPVALTIIGDWIIGHTKGKK